jgi:outer membrane protein insertion porin family
MSLNASTSESRAHRAAFAALALFVGALLSFASANAAEVRVQGLGWFGSREATRVLNLLLGEQAAASIDAAAIEDAALILFHKLEADGYLQPRVTAEITAVEGDVSEHVLPPDLSAPLPRPLAAQRVVFRVDRGVRYTIREIEFVGLATMKPDDAREFFVGQTMLVPLAAERVYSPRGVRQSAGNLEAELRLRGMADATVEVTEQEVDDRTGAARIRVVVHEGRLWRVRGLDYEVSGSGPTPPTDLLQARVGRRWSSVWRQDTQSALRRWYFERGHPDVSMQLAAAETKASDPDEHAVHVTVRITPGAQVRLGEIRFVGHESTREESMRRLVQAEPGDLLNPIELDDSQARLARLGIFDRVDLRYTAGSEPDSRDAVFAVREGRRQEINLLAGYGSYEQFRGGVEWNHFNLWGRAHSHRLQLVQSMKSSSGDYRYTVPDVFGTKINGTARLFGLRREELAFVREEYGANLSISRPIEPLGATSALSYTFRRVRNSRNELATREIDETQANIASLDWRLVRDKRDNPLVPRRGHRVIVQVETASKVFGGEVDYQQFTIGGSYHTTWGRGRWVHVGLEHALVTTFGAEDDSALPVSVRFFPGGDGSIRGYNRGEAAPRTATGAFIGAKSYVQLNLELEQALTPKISAVVFFDSLGVSARLAEYPWEELLTSAGVGVRYHTLIGPVRLEYGHNLNPRPRDPSGTLLFSVGFPF